MPEARPLRIRPHLIGESESVNVPESASLILGIRDPRAAAGRQGRCRRHEGTRSRNAAS